MEALSHMIAPNIRLMDANFGKRRRNRACGLQAVLGLQGRKKRAVFCPQQALAGWRDHNGAQARSPAGNTQAW
jgi:hypothetical protein